MSGMTVHVISSLRFRGSHAGLVLRAPAYLIAKYTTRPEMSSVKNAVSATRKK